MTYNEILPLAEVKNYLRLEEDFTEDDTALERMVRSALQFIEKRTNHIFQLRTDVNYTSNGNCITVFDYPILYRGDDVVLYSSDKVVFYSKSIIADVGYLSIDDIPSDLITAALDLIEQDYFGAENKTGERIISQKTMQIINSHRRFTVV